MAKSIAWRTRRSSRGFFARGEPSLLLAFCSFSRKSSSTLNTYTVSMVCTLSLGSRFKVATSVAGTRVIRSSWPALSWATRAASLAISLRTWRAQGSFGPQKPSKRSSTRSPLGCHDTYLYGPVPIAALPELKASLALSFVRPAAAFAETINRRIKSFGKVGAAPSVITSTVCGLMIFTSLTRRT